jgi:hypothetical protein
MPFTFDNTLDVLGVSIHARPIGRAMLRSRNRLILLWSKA